MLRGAPQCYIHLRWRYVRITRFEKVDKKIRNSTAAPSTNTHSSKIPAFNKKTKSQCEHDQDQTFPATTTNSKLRLNYL